MRVFSPRVWVCALLALATSDTDAQQTYDAIVVGSGPGGLVAAEYLSRDPSVSVLILEAGPASLAATGGTDTPGYAQGSGLTRFDIPGEYDYTTYNNDRPEFEQKYRVQWVSDRFMWLGNLVGGCSSINAALYFRPPNEYVTQMEWPFSAAQMVSKMDENEQIHGATDKPSPDGQWYTQEGYAVVSRAFLAQGYSEKTINDAAARNAKSKTFGHAPFTFKDGKRDTPAAAFWGKMSSRSNVELKTGASVDYVLRASGGKATGVVYNSDSRALLTSRGAVVMAAGALGTPKVLMQSGVGPSAQLSQLNGRSDFPGVSQAAGWITNENVGSHLFDTNVVFASFSHPDMSSFSYESRPSWAVNQYMNSGATGPWASSGPTLIGYENYAVGGRDYEFQMTALTVGFGSYAGRSDALTLALYVNNPESRASSGFDGNGNFKAFNAGTPYFGTDRDLTAMKDYAAKVVNTMTAQGATFLDAGSDATSVGNWVADSTRYITHHFGGSCYVSSNAADGNRCADEHMKVVGTSNVFVADASAMRDGTVNPYGFIMYIGREAAEQVQSYLGENNGGSETASCSAVETDVDFVGNDVGSALSASADGCCTICAADSDCGAFTWTSYNGGTCWLKSAKGETTASTGSVSAVLQDTTTSSCSTVEEDVDYSGTDIGNSPSASVDGCCAICEAFNGCGAYTWTDHEGGTCWLKSEKGSTISKSGAKSAVLGDDSGSSQCSSIEENVDYSGTDIGSALSSSAEGCCAICEAFNGCGAYTWTDYEGGTCWLKSEKGSTISKSGAKSAVLGDDSGSSQCSSIEENVDYSGTDIGSALSSSAEGCCTICEAAANCGAYTWTDYEGGTCWLKSEKGSTISKSGARSATLTVPTSQCSLVNNVDYYGNDLTTVPSAPSATGEGCCEICRAQDGCKAFTWTNQDGGTCWLKSASGTSSTLSGAVSGTI